MKLIASALLGVVLTLLATASASAGLVLQLNPADKSLALTGSDTGTPMNTILNTGVVSWELQGFTVEQEVLFDTSGVMFSTSEGSPISFALFSFSGGDGAFEVSLATSTSLTQTISGQGFFLSYADLSTTTQTALESLVGLELPLDSDSDFGPLAVTAVPEPSSCTVMGFGAAFSVLLRCGRKARPI